jgi:signal transduction histidine kinase
MKFTKAGTVYVKAEQKNYENAEGQQVMVTVRDTGIGIHPEIYPRLFTKFASKSQTGTGLGLFISKSIVEAHGGRIWAENNRNGNGATFAFTLPITLPRYEKAGETMTTMTTTAEITTRTE